jgi:hypothetical protein
LQTAINAAVCGDVIQIQRQGTSGGIGPVGAFTLPLKNCAANPITITSDGVAGSLPPIGTVAGPQYASHYARITSSGAGAPTIRFADSTNGWIIRYIDFPPVPSGYGDIVVMGDADNQFTSLEPYAITFEYNYMHGDMVFGQKRAIYIGSRDFIIRYNHIAQIAGLGQDAVGIGILNSTGDGEITDNWVEATGYSFMSGGGDPRNRTRMTITANPTTTGADVQTTEANHTCAELAPGMVLGILTNPASATNGLQWADVATVTNISGNTCTLTWTPALTIAPAVGATVRRDQVPIGVNILRNTFIKNVAWRNGILPDTPNPTTQTQTGTGTLPAGTYYYKIQAYNTGGYQGSTIYADPSVEVPATLSATGRVTLTWPTLQSATHVRVFRCTASGATSCDRATSASLTTFVDSGTVTWTSAQAVPSSGSRWTVKNNFEIKVGEDFLVEGNTLDTNWTGNGGTDGQSVWLKSVNQEGGCHGCYTEGIIFRSNIIRSTPAFIIVASQEAYGWQRPKPIVDLIIENNLIYDCNATWGSSRSNFNGPTINLTIRHNTWLCDGGSSSWFHFGDLGGYLTKNVNFTVEYNVAFRNSFGVWGQTSEGTANLNLHNTSYTFTENAIGGANCSNYPATTICVTSAIFRTQFVNYVNGRTGGDYNLAVASTWNNEAPGPRDLGADIAAINAAIGGTGSSTTPPVITTELLPNGVRTITYAQAINVTGGTPPYVCDDTGTVPTGLTVNATCSTGVTGTPTAAGSFTFGVTVTDAAGQIDTQPYTVVIADPIVITSTSPLLPAVINSNYINQIQYTGGLSPVTCTLASGTLPAGILLAESTCTIAGVPTSLGLSTFGITVTGSGGSFATTSFGLVVGSEPLPPGRPDFSGPLRQEIQTFRRSVAPTCVDRVAKGDKWINIGIIGHPATMVATTTCPTTPIIWEQDVADISDLNASNLNDGTIPDARFPASLPIVEEISAPEVTAERHLNFVMGACTEISIAGQARLCVDQTDNTAKISINGSEYTSLGSGTSTTTSTRSAFYAVHTPVSAATYTAWPGTLGAGTVEIFNQSFWRARLNLTGYSQARISVRIGVAANAGTTLFIQYSLDGTTWVTSGVTVPFSTTGTVNGSDGNGAWSTMPTAMLADVHLRIMATGGNGTTTPTLGNLVIEFN